MESKVRFGWMDQEEGQILWYTFVWNVPPLWLVNCTVWLHLIGCLTTQRCGTAGKYSAAGVYRISTEVTDLLKHNVMQRMSSDWLIDCCIGALWWGEKETIWCLWRRGAQRGSPWITQWYLLQVGFFHSFRVLNSKKKILILYFLKRLWFFFF